MTAPANECPECSGLVQVWADKSYGPRPARASRRGRWGGHPGALGHWHSAGPSLWGLDYLGFPYCRATDTEPPEPGDYTLEALPDAYLREAARELILEHEDT